MVIPQDDSYTISREVDFDYELFEPRKDNWPDTATSLPNDAVSSEVDYYVLEENEAVAQTIENAALGKGKEPKERRTC